MNQLNIVTNDSNIPRFKNVVVDVFTFFSFVGINNLKLELVKVSFQRLFAPQEVAPRTSLMYSVFGRKIRRIHLVPWSLPNLNSGSFRKGKGREEGGNGNEGNSKFLMEDRCCTAFREKYWTWNFENPPKRRTYQFNDPCHAHGETLMLEKRTTKLKNTHIPCQMGSWGHGKPIKERKMEPYLVPLKLWNLFVGVVFLNYISYALLMLLAKGCQMSMGKSNLNIVLQMVCSIWMEIFKQILASFKVWKLANSPKNTDFHLFISYLKPFGDVLVGGQIMFLC